jgi:hypothetical protein
LSNIKDTNSSISAELNGTLETVFDFKTGPKLFLPSTMITTWYRNISASSDRKEDLILGFPFCKREVLTYHIDSSYTVSMPADFDVNNDLILFSRKVTKGRGDEIIIATELQFKKHVIPPGLVGSMKENLQIVNKYLMQKLIISAK